MTASSCVDVEDSVVFVSSSVWYETVEFRKYGVTDSSHVMLIAPCRQGERL